MNSRLDPISARQQALDAACSRYLCVLFNGDANGRGWIVIRDMGAAVMASARELRTARLAEFQRRMSMSTGNPIEAVADVVRDALPTQAPGFTYEQIHESIGMWSKVTIRHAVRQLIEEGKVRRAGSHSAPLFYRASVVVSSGM